MKAIRKANKIDLKVFCHFMVDPSEYVYDVVVLCFIFVLMLRTENGAYRVVLVFVLLLCSLLHVVVVVVFVLLLYVPSIILTVTFVVVVVVVVVIIPFKKH